MAHGPAILRLFSTSGAAAPLGACAATTHNCAPSGARWRADLRGSPPTPAALHGQSNRLLRAGPPALKARLRGLHPSEKAPRDLDA
jgi:hypothetical protein